MRRADARIRYYLHIDPDTLSDEEWAMRVKEVDWLISSGATAQQQL